MKTWKQQNVLQKMHNQIYFPYSSFDKLGHLQKMKCIGAKEKWLLSSIMLLLLLSLLSFFPSESSKVYRTDVPVQTAKPSGEE